MQRLIYYELLWGSRALLLVGASHQYVTPNGTPDPGNKQLVQIILCQTLYFIMSYGGVTSSVN